MSINANAALIERQLEAYNQKNLEAWLATYASDAVQCLLVDGTVIAAGHEAMRTNILARFKEPDLRAELLHRMVCDDVVIDHERITRNFPEGRGSVEMLCIYSIRDGLIAKAQFKVWNQRLD